MVQLVSGEAGGEREGGTEGGREGERGREGGDGGQSYLGSRWYIFYGGSVIDHFLIVSLCS